MNPDLNTPSEHPNAVSEADLRAVGEVLTRWQIAEAAPAPEWVARMSAEAASIAHRQANLPSAVPRHWREHLRWWMTLMPALLRAQTQIVGSGLLLASALVLILGAAVSILMTTAAGAGVALPFILCAPIAAVISVAFVFTDEDDRLMELLSAMPIPPRTVFLGRLLLLFGLNAAGALLCSLFLAAFAPGLSLMPLIMAWLVPMTFLSALTFALSVWMLNPLFSLMLGLMGWIMAVWRHYGDPSALFPELQNLFPDLLGAPGQIALFVLALVFVGLTLAFLDRETSAVRSRR